MSEAISGVGVHLSRWDGSAYVALAEITSIKGPGKKRDTIEVTNLDSTGGYKEFIGGFREGGTVSLTMNFTRASYDLMNADFETDDVQYYAITIPDAALTTLEFEGFVQELPLNISAKDAITADVTILVSGKVEVHDGDETSNPENYV